MSAGGFFRTKRANARTPIRALSHLTLPEAHV